MSSSRRDFLKTTAVATGLSAVNQASSVLADSSGVHSGVNETLRVGLVGCGGRGTQAAIDALAADEQAELVAVGDAFHDRAEACWKSLKGDKKFGKRVTAVADRIFSDFDNYKQVIDLCDVVLLATPPHFRPQHLSYAVEQGKHAFVEKPIAVDAPGVRQVMATCRLAEEKKLSIVSGLCWRHDLGVRETMRRVTEEKAIGDIVTIESSYNRGTLWHRGDDSAWSRMEYQLRNWLYYTWLAGDHILEQAIHSLDKSAWLLGDIQPLRAMAMGGRQQRVDPKWDTFTTTSRSSTSTPPVSTSTSPADSKTTQQHTSTTVSWAHKGTRKYCGTLSYRARASGGVIEVPSPACTASSIKSCS